MPSIAVVMPAFNAGRWIDETLRSVLAQSRLPDEVIVVDDGSTDDTAERARAHGERVRVLQQPNGGPPAAYNRGFDEAASDYVAMCPADDLWHPRKLEWQDEILERGPAIDVLFAHARFFGRNEAAHPAPSSTGLLERDAFLRELYAVDVIPAPTAVVRRELHQRLGRFDESLPSEDYEFWLRALRAGASFYCDPRELVRLRDHGGNVSLRALEIWEMNHALHRAFAADLGDPGTVERLLASDLRVIARCRFGAGQAGGARAAYRESLRNHPSVEALLGAGALSVPGMPRLLTWVNRRRRARAAT
jgi:glycosyltransferase involved in cell wall biosynthesis